MIPINKQEEVTYDGYDGLGEAKDVAGAHRGILVAVEESEDGNHEE